MRKTLSQKLEDAQVKIDLLQADAMEVRAARAEIANMKRTEAVQRREIERLRLALRALTDSVCRDLDGPNIGIGSFSPIGMTAMTSSPF